MADEHRTWKRQGEAFWRAHHEAWKRSDLNQRQYCEFHGLRQKAFENWRQKFRAEPQPAARKLLYRRGGLSHTLSHSLSHPFDHTLSHGTYPSSLPPAPIVPPGAGGPSAAIQRRGQASDYRRGRWATVCSLITTAKLPSSTTSSPSPTQGRAGTVCPTTTQ
jgi:hypothetical protein